MPFIGALVVALLVGTWLLFKDSTNLVQGFWRIYWITRDFTPPQTPFISKAFMRELAPPWRVGNGIQVRLPKNYVFQVGICLRTSPPSEEVGVLQAVGGRYMDEVTPEDIGEW